MSKLEQTKLENFFETQCTRVDTIYSRQDGKSHRSTKLHMGADMYDSVEDEGRRFIRRRRARSEVSP